MSGIKNLLGIQKGSVDAGRCNIGVSKNFADTLIRKIESGEEINGNSHELLCGQLQAEYDKKWFKFFYKDTKRVLDSLQRQLIEKSLEKAVEDFDVDSVMNFFERKYQEIQNLNTFQHDSYQIIMSKFSAQDSFKISS